MSSVGFIRKGGEGQGLLKDVMEKHSRQHLDEQCKENRNVLCEKHVQTHMDNTAFL